MTTNTDNYHVLTLEEITSWQISSSKMPLFIIVQAPLKQGYHHYNVKWYGNFNKLKYLGFKHHDNSSYLSTQEIHKAMDEIEKLYEERIKI